MELRSWKGFCLCAMGGTFPPDAQKTDALFSPLVFLVDRDPARSRGWFRIDTVDALFEPENCAVLLPPERRAAPENLRDFVAKNGATVLNTAFARAFSKVSALAQTPSTLPPSVTSFPSTRFVPAWHKTISSSKLSKVISLPF